MKNFKIVLALSVIAGCCFLYACGGDPFRDKCESDYTFKVDSYFGFHILDKKTKQKVLLIGETTYNYDTVKVYDENWKVPFLYSVGFDGFVGFVFVDEGDVGVTDKLISKRFYMYFNYMDIDTIDIAFETKYDKCQEQRMKYFKVAYNDSIYFDGPATGANINKVPGSINFLKEY